MLKFIATRLLQAIPVLLAVVTITFFLVRMAPGDPLSTDKSMPPSVLKALEAQYQLDKPMWQQFTSYVGNLLQGDFGPSFKYPGRTVNELITAGLPTTATHDRAASADSQSPSRMSRLSRRALSPTDVTA